jgi:hypothetical protein
VAAGMSPLPITTQKQKQKGRVQLQRRASSMLSERSGERGETNRWWPRWPG